MYVAYLTSSNTVSITDLNHGLYGVSSASAVRPSFSPDGKYLLYSDSNGIPTLAFWTTANPKPLLNAIAPSSRAWAPFFVPKTFLGASPVVQSSASGFMLNHVSDTFASFFSFSATTPATASIAPVAGSGSATQVFKVSADAITLYRYLNDYNGGLVSVTPAAGTKQMLVSVDSVTGKIGFIAPFLTSPTKQAQEVRKWNQMVLNARVSGIFDGKGKNLAPTGASGLTVDLKTGKLLGIQR